jgi:hypothetical protein
MLEPVCSTEMSVNCTGIYIISQEVILLIVTAVRTSNPRE